MILKVKKAEHLEGEFFLPASKSYSIRAFIIAAAGGTSTIIRPSNCDDALVALNVARRLGASVKHLSKDTYLLKAKSSRLEISRIDVGESGTVLRFLLPLICLENENAVISGQGTLLGRPNFHLTKSLRNLGINIKGQGPDESIPIIKKKGRLEGGTIMIDGTLSSQFISAFLIAAPQLEKDTQLQVTGKDIVSQTYITMTLQILKKTGITVEEKSPRFFYIKGSQRFKGLRNFYVPSDYGLAAFFLAAGSLVSSKLILKGNFKTDLVQADGAILDFLKKMDVKFTKKNDAIILNGPFALKGGKCSLKDCPDLVPIMAVMALFAKGPTRLFDIAHAKAKESDRINDLANELRKVGANISAKSSELIIHPQDNYRTGCVLDPHHDHRLAMAFAVLGLKLNVTVKDIECTHKSYPDFVKDLKKIGAGTV